MRSSLVVLLALFATASASLALSDYFVEQLGLDDTGYQVHRIDVSIARDKFQWVLFGQKRGCDVKINHKNYKGVEIGLQGNSQKIIMWPKKNYRLIFDDEDTGRRHSVVLLNIVKDASYSSQKLVHDLLRTNGNPTISINHVELYINDNYNGLFLLKEDVNENFIVDRFGTAPPFWANHNHGPAFDFNRIGSNGILYTEEESDIIEESDSESLRSESLVMHDSFLNYTRPALASMNQTAVYAYTMAMHLLEIIDIDFFNHYLVPLPQPDGSVKFEIVLWDTDRMLGVDSSYAPYTYNLTKSVHILNRPLVDTHGADYTSAFLTQLDDGGLFDLAHMQEFIDRMEAAIVPAAERDNEKWSSWYCSKHRPPMEAFENLRRVLFERHNQTQLLLMGEPFTAGEYGPVCSPPWGTGNPGMLALLYCLLVANILVICYRIKYAGAPDAPIDSRRNSEDYVQRSGEGAKKANGPYGGSSAGEPVKSGKSYDKGRGLRLHDEKSSTAAAAFHSARARVGKSYWANLLVAVFLVVVYHVYAIVDVLDDTDILGHPYMSNIKHVWIYLPVILNFFWLIPKKRVRLWSWIVVVLLSNLWGMYDLFVFAEAEAGDNSSTITNSREVIMSLDSSKCLASDGEADDCNGVLVTALFVLWRVIAQATICSYSLRIPTLVRTLTRDAAGPRRRTVGDSKAVELTDADNWKGVDPESPEHSRRNSGTERADSLEDVPGVGTSSTGGGGGGNAESSMESSEEAGLRQSRISTYRRMQKFMRYNFVFFFLLCVGGVVYLAWTGQLAETFGDILFTTVVSMIIMLNIRTFYSTWKWYWLYYLGFEYDDLEAMFGTRDPDRGWSIENILARKPVPRTDAWWLPCKNLSTEKKVRTVDAWTKKVAHTYDGLLVFLVSAKNFEEGGNSTDVYTLAYAISLLYITLYYRTIKSEGPLGWIVYGAKSRIMDGFLGRENEVFGYMFDKYMIPVSTPLLLWLRDEVGDGDTVTMSYIIFMPIIVGDSMAELVGSTWGKQKIKVFGMGEVNKKSWEGFWGMFFSSFAISIAVVAIKGLSWDWYLLCFIVSMVDTWVELISFRSTDNVTMMLAGALISVAFAHAKS